MVAFLRPRIFVKTPDNFEMAIAFCEIDSCFTIIVLIIHIQLVVLQQFDNCIGMACLDRQHEGCVTLFVLMIQIQLVVVQQFDYNIGMACLDCQQKSCLAKLICSINVCPLLQ